MTKTNALHSLYGRTGTPGAREQTVLTPQWILDWLRDASGRTLALDPCTLPTNPTRAQRVFTVADDGLAQSWACGPGGFVYVNPPYADLQPWLAKCQTEASYDTPIYALVPWRGHRQWFAAAVQSASSVTHLAPFPFVGSTSAFPAPLCIITWHLPPVRSLTMWTKRGGIKEMVTMVQ